MSDITQSHPTRLQHSIPTKVIGEAFRGGRQKCRRQEKRGGGDLRLVKREFARRPKLKNTVYRLDLGKPSGWRELKRRLGIYRREGHFNVRSLSVKVTHRLTESSKSAVREGMGK